MGPADRAVGTSIQTRHAIPVLAFAAGIALFNLHRFFSLEYAVDDAWISFRYARNLVEHGVLSYNLAGPPAEGMSNLLWTILSSLWIALLPGVDPVVPARILGAMLHLATVAAVGLLAARIAGEEGARPMVAAAVAAGLVALSGSMAFHALSGLETALFGFLFVCALLALHRAFHGSPRPAGLVCGACLGLLAMTRPEGALAGAALCAGVMLLSRPHARALRLLLWTGLPFLFLFGVTELFRWSVYGALLPNTFAAKPPDPAEGLNYFFRYALFGLGGAGWLLALPAVRSSAFSRIVALAALVMVLGTVWSGGDWMPGNRRFTLASTALAALAGAGFASFGERMRPLAFALLVMWVAGNAADAVRKSDSAAYPPLAFSHLGRLSEGTPGVREVALADIGRFGWHYRGAVFDLAGVTDRRLARSSPGGHLEKWNEDYFWERRPDLAFALVHTDPTRDHPLDGAVTLRSVTERKMVRSMSRRGGYSLHTAIRIARRLHLFVFRSEGLLLPERLWGPPWELDASVLLNGGPSAGIEQGTTLQQ